MKKTMAEQVRENFTIWNTLKVREVEAGLLTQERYEELKAESLRVMDLQIASFNK